MVETQDDNLIIGKAQLAACQKIWVVGPLEWDAAI